ncbi:MAG: sugar phosphate nucleotidyltransferase [Anaerolineae bacterium]
MYAVLFAGGVGQRLWPISRKNTPKQFSPIIGNKSSLALAVERLLPQCSPDQIFISTNAKYDSIVARMFPQIPHENLLLEPVKRDLAAAVALSFFKMYAKGLRGPVILQWADSYIQNTDVLQQSIEVSQRLLEENPDRIIFLGEIPRFPNENLGWIEHGQELGRINDMPYYRYQSWSYRPRLDICEEMFKSGNYVWNTGYFVTTIEFIVTQFRKLAPEITNVVEEIVKYVGTDQEQAKLLELYPTIPSMHFDEAFLERLGPEYAVLLKGDLRWADPGSLYALKEALQAIPEANAVQGLISEIENTDCLFINEDDTKVVAAMGLQGVVVVNTRDAVLVISKSSVRYLARLLAQIEKDGHPEIL